MTTKMTFTSRIMLCAYRFFDSCYSSDWIFYLYHQLDIVLMSEIDGESFLGIVDIPKYPFSSKGIKTACSYHPWQMSPWESYPFDHIVPMLSNAWIYFGT
jgi:hypothetical protein